ncbi:MAG: hypothetical protein HKN23_21745 [Verrucomicrobiales bacterium]|nr:hypothetical protein [Verrucomicrobiales bacterium]
MAAEHVDGEKNLLRAVGNLDVDLDCVSRRLFVLNRLRLEDRLDVRIQGFVFF